MKHMKHLFLSAVFAIAAGSYVVFLTFAAYPSVAGASQLRATFDGNIRNNSLALSPDETTAVVSNSERSDIIVYDLPGGSVRGVLSGYVTQRNIVFAPDGKAFYISDSSLGEIVKVDSATLTPLSRLAIETDRHPDSSAQARQAGL